MQFFTTSEASGLASDKIRPVRNLIEEKINTVIANKNYGTGVKDWGHIIICCAPEFYEGGFLKEIKKYTEKEADIELRLRIDYEEVVNSDEKKIFKLLSQAYLKGIKIAETELNIPDFDFAAYRKDLNDLFKKETWI